MAKSNPKKLRSKKTVLLAIFILIVSILALILITLFAERKAQEEQKRDLNQSAENMTEISKRFVEIISYEKSTQKQSPNSCSNVGAKYSTSYTCGNDFTVTVSNVEESQFLELNSKLANLYKANANFTNTAISQPQRSNLTGILSAISESKFNNTDIKCYVASQYDSVNRIATFNGGCNQVVKSLLFPKSN